MSSSAGKPGHDRHEPEQAPSCWGPGPDHQRTRFLKRGIYEHFRWPFKVQIIGYVSFEHGPQYESDEISFFESGSICTRFSKCQIVYPIFCILLGLGCMSYYWFFGSYYFEKKFSLFYSLENLGIVALGVSASTWILFLKVYGLIYRRRAAAFFKSTITDVTKGIYALNVHHDDCRRVMDEMRRGTLNMIALYLTIIGVHLFALGFINNIVIAYFTGSSFGDLANSAITILWDLMCYGHVGLSIWVTSYLKLYLSCMQILNLELQIFEMCQAGQITRDHNDHDEPRLQSQSHPVSRSRSPSPLAAAAVPEHGDLEVGQERQKRPINRGRRAKNTVEPIELSTLPPITIPLPSILKSPGAQSTHSWLDEFTKTTGQDKDKESNHEHENENAHEEVEVKISREPQPPPTTVKQPHLSEYVHRQFEPILKNCIRFYYLIETCMENFNAFFSTVLVVEFLYCVAVVIAMSFYMYVVVIENPQPPPIIIQGAVTLLLHVLVLYDYSTTPVLMAEETKKVLSKLQVISLQPLSFEMRYMMQILVTKISSSSPEPTPGRFFTINRTLITSIVSALTTYLVILIQFRQEDRRRIKAQ